MGGSSSKRTFFWQNKKMRSPVRKAWSQLRRALPNKKRKKKRIASLVKLKREKHSQKRFSLSTDKKQPISLKRFSLGNIRKDSIQAASPGRKDEDGGGLGKVGEQIRRRFSQGTQIGLGTRQEVGPPSVNLKDTKKKMKRMG